MNKFDYICLGLVGVGALASALLYGQLPDPMPTHWNVEGVADGFTPLPSRKNEISLSTTKSP